MFTSSESHFTVIKSRNTVQSRMAFYSFHMFLGFTGVLKIGKFKGIVLLRLGRVQHLISFLQILTSFGFFIIGFGIKNRTI